jgi:Cu2+-exporting ATPase
LQVGLLSADPEAADRARLLGFDFHHVCATDEDKTRYVAECQRAGHRVAFVGNCRANPTAAAQANVAIAPVGDPGEDSDPADVWLLQADYGRLAVLWEVARASRRQSQMQHGMTLIPNLTCVAGAFLFGFTSLAAVIISNLGTYSVYKRSVQSLQETERRLLNRRAPVRRRRTIEAAHENPAGKCELILANSRGRRV